MCREMVQGCGRREVLDGGGGVLPPPFPGREYLSIGSKYANQAEGVKYTVTKIWIISKRSGKYSYIFKGRFVSRSLAFSRR
jgi:hypothetical protein